MKIPNANNLMNCDYEKKTIPKCSDIDPHCEIKPTKSCFTLELKMEQMLKF